MKKFKRYSIRFCFALIAFLSGSALYLFLPPLTSSIRNVPPETPVAFVADTENNGKRCQTKTRYVSEKPQYDDGEIVDPFCADVQMKLNESARTGDVSRIRVLLAQGANPMGAGPDSNGGFMRPLPVAAMSDKSEAVRLLLDNGGDVNDHYQCCMTSLSLLMMAAQHHDVSGARLLLARGADMDFRGFEGETTFEIAVSKSDEDIVQLLDEAGGLSLTQRAELRIAKLPRMNLREVHIRFIRWNWIENPRHDLFNSPLVF